MLRQLSFAESCMHGLPSTTPCPALLLRFPASAAPTSRRGYVRSPPQAAFRVGRIASLPSASVARPPSAALPRAAARGLAQLDASRECSAGMLARPLDRRQKMGPHEHAPVLVADEGEAVCLPLMALGPAVDYASSVANGCCSVKSAVALQGSIGHRFPVGRSPAMSCWRWCSWAWLARSPTS